YTKAQPAAAVNPFAACTAAAATPTHSGRYALPFFHIPHQVSANDRATFRRAIFGDRPAANHLRYWSANGFFPWAAADLAAPSIVLSNTRFTCPAPRSFPGPFPEPRRSKPMPRYFHKACFFANRQGVSSHTHSIAARTQPIPGKVTIRCNTSSFL